MTRERLIRGDLRVIDGVLKRSISVYPCARLAVLIVVICPHHLTLPSIDPDN